MIFHGSKAQWRVIHSRMAHSAPMPINASHHSQLFSMICTLFSKTNLQIPEKIQVAPSNLIDAEISYIVNPFTQTKTPMTLYITQGAINKYTKEQMAGMIGHEIGHLLQNSMLPPAQAEYDADKRSAKLTSPHDIISSLKYFANHSSNQGTKQSNNDVSTNQKQDMENYFGNNPFLKGLVSTLPANSNSTDMPSTNVNNEHPQDKKRIQYLESTFDNANNDSHQEKSKNTKYKQSQNYSKGTPFLKELFNQMEARKQKQSNNS